jgi:hypothetical protein
VDEIARTGNGTVHVRFRREVHDMSNAVVCQHPQNIGFDSQIHLFKDIFRVSGDLFQIRQMPRVGQAIQVHQPRDLRPVNDVMDHIGSDEPGAAGDEQIHFNNKATKELS